MDIVPCILMLEYIESHRQEKAVMYEREKVCVCVCERERERFKLRFGL